MATFSLSPAIDIREVDYSTIIPQIAISKIGMVGYFPTGPVEEIIDITSENILKKYFGEPTEDNYRDYFSAKNVLDYTSLIKIVRVVPETAKNAVLSVYTDSPADSSLSKATLIKNDEDIPTIAFDANEVIRIYSKYPDWYNSIKVAIANYTDFETAEIITGISFKSQFDYGPSNSNQIAAAILVENKDGEYEIVETFIASVNENDKDWTGKSLYIPDVFRRSKYIRAYHNANLTNVFSFTATKLTSGWNGVLNFKTTSTNVSNTRKVNYIVTTDQTLNTTDIIDGELMAFLDDTAGEIKIYTFDAGTTTWNLTETINTDGTYYVLSPVGGNSTDAGLIEGNAYKVYSVIIDNTATDTFIATDLTPTLTLGDAFVTDVNESYYFVEDLKPFHKSIYDETAFNGTLIPLSAVLNGLELYRDSEIVDVNILIDGAYQNVEIHNKLDDITKFRKDCIAIINVPFDTVVEQPDTTSAVNAMLNWRNTTFPTSTSYIAIYGNWKLQYDKYNDKKRWIPLSGDIAGIYAYTDYVTDAWYAPAGKKRGLLKNVIKLAISPNKPQRDSLYTNEINPVITKLGTGHVVFGQKTSLHSPSSFNRVNVRRLFIVLEKAIATASEAQLFEFNDTFSRNLFKAMVEPFLRNVKGRRGIQDFYVICDETNNTPEVIDSNGFVADIYVKPNKVTEFIHLNFINVPTGVEFEEIVENLPQ